MCTIEWNIENVLKWEPGFAWNNENVVGLYAAANEISDKEIQVQLHLSGWILLYYHPGLAQVSLNRSHDRQTEQTTTTLPTLAQLHIQRWQVPADIH